MSDIFISYARADSEFALKLAKDLRSAGANLWLDQLDLSAGDRWDIAVEKALKDCACLLVVLSPTSVNSNNVMDEVSFALENHKKVVPVLYRRCDIPFRIQRLQYIDLTAAYNDGFTQLLRALSVEQPSQTTQTSAQTIPAGKATPGVTRIGPGINTKRFISPLVAVLLAAVVVFMIYFWSIPDRSPIRPVSIPDETAANRARWPSHNFPPPNGGLLVFTIMQDGNPACASYDGAQCLWGLTYDQIDFGRLKPLVCGEEHRAKWGVTGYEDPKHWCNLARNLG